ncbi:hypothetical protein EVAR_47610_1 [Eumeta japonica]|uniref:Uncharacterized protein n=1 Tax=Eumeta variegata TaxID=151549 RepID=A0A4C1WS32_EUMVA|nr:hypothetical protein EVAR_47590_1 [Eumeta japonica]GBP52940.1 hypothetical protein EVAR_47595_1 [Eumeta japonica]GBP52951.1 hypothetical protein EVAR_47606_1 [Eumeta japonica]GBP52955.1 hypothetical protein EVAR_47610_1 [Eumeta japonica]
MTVLTTDRVLVDGKTMPQYVPVSAHIEHLIDTRSLLVSQRDPAVRPTATHLLLEREADSCRWLTADGRCPLAALCGKSVCPTCLTAPTGVDYVDSAFGRASPGERLNNLSAHNASGRETRRREDAHHASARDGLVQHSMRQCAVGLCRRALYRTGIARNTLTNT